MTRSPYLLAATLALAVPSGPARASSDDAWDAFRAEVETACLAAAEGTLDEARAVVDPFGSERYGLAVLTGTERGGDAGPRSVVCVFDKQSRAAEIGSVLDLGDVPRD